MARDRLGRKRRPGQGRGLRSLHPVLPVRWVSRVMRLAMSEVDWRRFEEHIQQCAASEPTRARAAGKALSRLLDDVQRARDEARSLDWMDWERSKALRLLVRRQDSASGGWHLPR